MSIKDFTKAFGVSRSTAYKLMASGELRTFKLGKRRLIPVQSAEEWFGKLIEDAS